MKNRFIRIAFMAASVWVASLGATSLQAQMKKIEFKEYNLSNGLHVILHEDKSAPVVTTVVHYKVGSRDENPERTGFAHFFEHLMFESTTDIPRATMDKYVQGAGGDLNAHTSFDETVYHFRMPSNEVQLALWIEYERMRGLNVNEIGVETQRGVVKEERKGRYDNSPYGTWNETMFKRLFQGGSYQWTPIGSAQHIDKAEIAEFREFYDKFYQPNNAVLVVAGDFDEKAVRHYIDEYFGSLPKGKEIVREKFILPDFKEQYRETIKDQKAQLPGVFIGYRGPKKGDADSYAMSMLLEVMSAGESSRMYQRLVDKDAIAVQASVFPFTLQYAGAIVAVGIAAPGKNIGDVEKTMYEEIARVIKDGVTDEEFTKAKNIKEAEFIEGKKGSHEKAMTLASYYAYFNDAGLMNTEIKKYESVTKADLQRVAKKYLSTENRVVLTYLPASMADEGNQPPSDKK